VTGTGKLPASERRKQIVEKATLLFSVHGFKKMTMAKLAEECDISEPALYRYFTSKKNLYAEVLKSIQIKINTSNLREKISGLDDIEKILFSLATDIMNVYNSHPEITRLLLFCSLEGHELAQKVFSVIRSPYTDILVNALKRLKRMKKIRPVDPLITARCYIGMVTECAIRCNMWETGGASGGNPEKNMRNTIPIFAGGLKL